MFLQGPVVITGCSRGLGLEMVKQLVGRNGPLKPKLILATCRKPEEAKELQETQNKHPELVQVHRLDVTEYDHFPEFSAEMKAATQDFGGIGMLINNAGHSLSLTRLSSVKPDQMISTFKINTIGPLMLVQALVPLMKKPKEERLIVNISSTLGSIETNQGKGGGIYPYRTSKAALNMVTRSLSCDLASSWIRAISIHPGWVKTALGGPNAPLEVKESVEGVLNVIENFNSDTQNGRFVSYDGSPIPW